MWAIPKNWLIFFSLHLFRARNLLLVHVCVCVVPFFGREISACKWECPSPSSVTRPIHNRYLSCWVLFMNFVLCFVLRLGAMFFRFFPRKKTQRNIRVRTGKEFGGRKKCRDEKKCFTLQCNAYFGAERSCAWPPSVSANVIHILWRLLKCKSSTVIIMHVVWGDFGVHTVCVCRQGLD